MTRFSKTMAGSVATLVLLLGAAGGASAGDWHHKQVFRPAGKAVVHHHIFHGGPGFWPPSAFNRWGPPPYAWGRPDRDWRWRPAPRHFGHVQPWPYHSGLSLVFRFD